ncbi:MAG: phosphate-starvation-inducible PsiE family protein [Actinomycetota bacterium]|nr:phosphate-starvation-inducible PsiE family protein [Actinomycetota bacterium]
MPDEKEDPLVRVRLGNRALVLVEDAIYVSIAALLAIGAIVLVVRAAIELVTGALASGPDPLLDTLDAILLVFIFVELLYAVRITLKERQIVAEPFLIAGILVCIKEIIVLAVKSANEYIGKGPEFARAMTEIGLLGGLVLLLSASGVLLRKKEKEPEENESTDNEEEI